MANPGGKRHKKKATATATTTDFMRDRVCDDIARYLQERKMREFRDSGEVRILRAAEEFFEAPNEVMKRGATAAKSMDDI